MSSELLIVLKFKISAFYFPVVIRTALGLTLRRDREIGRSVLGTSLPAREAEGARLEQSMTGTVRAEKGEPPGDELCTQPL